MTNKELRKLSRRELLEMLIDQSRELIQVQQELDEAREKLEQRNIALAEAGSIAEAALRLNHVFEAAQQAADQYLESVKAASMDNADALMDAETIIRSAENERQALLEKTRMECEEMLQKAREECRHIQYDALRKEIQ